MRLIGLILAVFCLITVYAQYPLHENLGSNIQSINTDAHVVHHFPDVYAPSIRNRMVNYVQRLHRLVAEARLELVNNNNQRPSTPYSMDDILFSIKYYLPSWIYPTYAWKQETKMRRRQITRVLNSAPLLTRSRLTQVRNQMVRWTKESEQLFNNNYTVPTLEGLSSLLNSAHDFVKAATDAELMADPMFLSTGYVTLDDAVKLFLTNNQHNFDLLLKHVHHQFNDLVCLSGNLRRPMESIRQDAMQETLSIRDQLFSSHLERRLHHLSWRIRNELQLMSDELRNLQDESASMIRQHTANALLAEVDSMHDLKLAVSRSASSIQRVWSQAGRELVQKPTTVDYWINVMEELRGTIHRLARDLAMKQRAIQLNRKRTNSPKKYCSWGFSLHPCLQ
ncbi:hypothetical protein BD560DRAFT_489333 [Blakeslea trispora]|nr:hypothetical protein BD560DRAFT_489333 [Blakeslea trispora]